MTLPIWMSKCAMQIPTAKDAILQITAWYTKMFRPFCNGFCCPIVGNPFRGSPIAHLLYCCRPSAIFRAVWPVVVNSIKRSPLFWLAHISNEIRVIIPTIAYCNTTSTIILKCWISGIKASLAHTLPNLIAARIFVFVTHLSCRCTMRQVHNFVVCFLMASARCGMSSSKVTCKSNSCISTFALT